MQAIILSSNKEMMEAMKYFESKSYKWSDGDSIMKGRLCLIDQLPMFLHIDRVRGRLSWSDRLDDSTLIRNWQPRFKLEYLHQAKQNTR